LFNKADVKEDNWLYTTFKNMHMNIKKVFHKLFLPQLEASNLSESEKAELKRIYQEFQTKNGNQ